MSTTVFLAGQRLRLEDRELLGVGGEGRVFRHGDQAIKVFFAMTEARRKKLAAFPRALPSSVVAPLALCEDEQGLVVGYAMRALEGAVDLQRLGQRKWRERNLGMREVLGVFRALHASLAELHGRRIVLGDLNDGNVVLTVSGGAWQPWLIDADSMQFASFPCTVAHERFLDPRLYGVDLGTTAALSRESDGYAFAVLLFTSLLCVHPYGGAHASYPTLLRRAEARHSVLRGDVKLPHAAFPLQILGDDTLDWFARVFDHDLRAPFPTALLEARFVRCSCGVEHARRACPACSLTMAIPAPAPVRTLGRIRVTRLSREDGVRFLAQRSTSVASFGAPRSSSSQVRLDGDWLIRTADETRIGQVLEGQTHVAAGERLGFAFYRAGLLTMTFLFDVQRGPLRQLALPNIEGRLVDWSVTFDDAHALFCTTTEKNGRVLQSAHLVDARGELLASETGSPGSSAMLHGSFGKCLAAGAILAPTDDGLVLVRADRAARSFVLIRAFPETRDLVPPDAELLVGPGGSVYVVTHDEIIHLSFEGNPSP